MPPPYSDEPLAAGAIVAGYRIEKLLGFGGMGAVYAAVHPIIGKRAAVKVIQGHAAQLATGIERFIQEARLVNQIHHPGIVDVFGFDALPDGRPVLVMELLEGETLAELLSRRGRLPTEETISLILPVLGALSAAHSAGVIHRDLKPENLFVVRGVDGRATVKVLDFGIAKLIDAPPGSGLTGATGAQLGTPKYMSPEQCRMEPIDARSDLYGMGLILYEMLSGRLPFVGNSPAEFLGQHLYQQPTPLDAYVQVDPRLAALVMRMLAKDKDGRPESATAVERELRQIIASFAGNATMAASQLLVPIPIPQPKAIADAAAAAGGTAISGAPRSPSKPPPPTSTGRALEMRGAPSIGSAGTSSSGISGTASVEENRLCTILFAEVAGLEGLAGRISPEQAKEILDGFFSAMTSAIEKQGGVIDKYTADGVMAVFGVPRSTDNDAERAVRAALALQLAVAKLARRDRRLATAKVSVRVGVNTGRVFAGWVGGSARRDFTVMGDAVTIASRLVESAPESAIVIGRDTFRHVTGVFVVDELPPVMAKGKSEPIVGYRVSGIAKSRPSGPSDEFYGAATKFVGRKGDLDRLVDAMDQVIADRRAQLVTIVGPAGAGKSRLSDELGKHLDSRTEACFVMRGRGTYLSMDATYDLASALLRSAFHIHGDDPVEVVEQKIRNGVRSFGRASGASASTSSITPLTDPLSRPSLTSLSITGADPGSRPSFTNLSASFIGSQSGMGMSPVLPDLDPVELGDTIEFLAQMLGARAAEALTSVGESVDDVKARMNSAVARLLSMLGTRGPIVILCDGLEAADDASLDLLDYLLLRMGDAPLLMVCAGRPELYERRPHWGEGKEGHTRLNLTPLPRRALEEMARDLLQRAPAVSPDFVRRLVDRADGNPLVMKETIRVLVDAGAVKRTEGEPWAIDEDRLDQLSLPSTIYGIAQARLDRLPPEVRGILQRAAVVGKVFWEGAIESMGAGSTLGTGFVVREALERLRANDIVRARDGSTFPAEREWAFGDTVTREVAYESLSQRVREQHHRAVARWLGDRGGVVVEGNPALLAFHYDRGGVVKEAIAHYGRAGLRAAALGHNLDALKHLLRACEIADSTKGTGLPESSSLDLAPTEELRVLDWNERVQLRLDLADTMRRLGRLDEAQEAYERARGDVIEAERRKNATLDEKLQRRFRASVEFRLGQVEKVRGVFDKALERYKAAFWQLGTDPDAKILAPLFAAIAFAQYRTGKLEAGLESCRKGLAVVRRLERGEPDWVDAVSRLFQTMGVIFDHRKQLVRAERMYLLAGRVVDERRFPQLAAVAANNLGVVYYRRGKFARARELFMRSLLLKERVGDLYDLAVAYNNLADAELMMGDMNGTIEKVQRALHLAEGLSAKDLLPDAYRILAEALRQRGEVAPALRAADRAFELSLAPAGRAYLPSTAQALAQCCESAIRDRASLDEATLELLDPIIERARERVPHALESAGMDAEAEACRRLLQA